MATADYKGNVADFRPTDLIPNKVTLINSSHVKKYTARYDSYLAVDF